MIASRYRHSQFRSSGFTLIELIVVILLLGALIAHWAIQPYERNKTKKMLDALPGVCSAYFDRVGALDRTFRLSAEIYQTKTPGQYQRMLGFWLRAAKEPEPMYGGKPKPSWLMELEKQEQAQVLDALRTAGIAVDELSALHAKLDKISPQLSDAESAAVMRAAEPVYSGLLGMARQETADKIVLRLQELGASTGGLDGNHIRLSDRGR